MRYVNSEKGKRGFVKSYNTLGKTEQIRIPISILEKIKTLVNMLEQVAQKKDMNTVNKILDNVIVGLEKVINE